MNDKAQMILAEGWLDPSDFPTTNNGKIIIQTDHPRDGGALLVDQETQKYYAFYDQMRAVKWAEKNIDHDYWNVFELDLRL